METFEINWSNYPSCQQWVRPKYRIVFCLFPLSTVVFTWSIARLLQGGFDALRRFLKLRWSNEDLIAGVTRTCIDCFQSTIWILSPTLFPRYLQSIPRVLWLHLDARPHPINRRYLHGLRDEVLEQHRSPLHHLLRDGCNHITVHDHLRIGLETQFRMQCCVRSYRCYPLPLLAPLRLAYHL